MPRISLVEPQLLEASKTADPRTQACFTTIQQVINGELDSTNINVEGLETGSYKNGSVTEAKLSAAVQTLLNQATSGLEFEEKAASFEAEPGKFYRVTGSGAATVTLPKPGVGATMGFYNSRTGDLTLNATEKGGVGTFGDYSHGGNVKLAPDQHLVIDGDAELHWLIVSGEAKREQKYQSVSPGKAGMEAGWELSATRPAIANVETITTTTIRVGGEAVGTPVGGTILGGLFVGPGEKISGATAANIYYKLL